jgi:hypothetical protein
MPNAAGPDDYIEALLLSDEHPVFFVHRSRTAGELTELLSLDDVDSLGCARVYGLALVLCIDLFPQELRPAVGGSVLAERGKKGSSCSVSILWGTVRIRNLITNSRG